MNKLKKSILPNGHSKDDFKCFGPPSTKDGEFSNTMLCDLGCFKQGQVDSNKYYFACVAQSNLSQDWYVYVEYGRTGSTTNPQFQFVQFSSKEEACSYYEKQLHKKNDKRGMWVDHPQLGKILQPKPNKDCYLVRPQTTRNTGLPDAKTITSTQVETKVKSTTSKKQFDNESERLLKDLSIGTQSYARSIMVNEALPTMDTIEECRKICDAATGLGNELKTDAKILHSNDLEDLTQLIYSRIPKKKGKKEGREDWLLTPQNVIGWQQDLDAFESVLKNQDAVTVTHDYPFALEHISLASNLGKFLHNWFKAATKNRHSYLRNPLNVKHIWKIDKPSDWLKFCKYQNTIKTASEKPFHQSKREDLSETEKGHFKNTGTWMLFHGTRSANVGGILRESLRLPKTLSNVSINGAMWGSNSLYFADDWKKSAGYCSLKNSYWARGTGSIRNRNAFMFIADVVMGNAFIPKNRCHTVPSGYNCIFAKGGVSGVINNEIVIQNSSQAYLRYLVEFGV
jgi:predicted DNA-binding WGR domain protein